jgi:hypothetical protein
MAGNFIKSTILPQIAPINAQSALLLTPWIHSYVGHCLLQNQIKIDYKSMENHTKHRQESMITETEKWHTMQMHISDNYYYHTIF